MSKRASRCLAVEPWSRGAVSRPAEETLARGGVSGFPQVRFDSWEEAGGSSSWRHSCLRPPPPTPHPRRDPRPRPGPAQHGPAAPGGSGAAGGGRSRVGPAGSDETSDVHYGRARGDTHAPSPASAALLITCWRFSYVPPPPQLPDKRERAELAAGLLRGGLRG